VAKMSVLVFWVVTPWGLVGEDGGSMFLQNIGIYLQGHMVLLHRRPTSTHLSSVKPLDSDT
jgi:hypothetical protein